MMEQFTVFVLLFSLFAFICKSEITTVNEPNIQEKNHEQRIRNLEENYLSLVSQAMAKEVMMTNMQETFDLQLKTIEDKYMSEANVKCQQFQLKLKEMENIFRSHDHTNTAKKSTKKNITSTTIQTPSTTTTNHTTNPKITINTPTTTSTNLDNTPPPTANPSSSRVLVMAGGRTAGGNSSSSVTTFDPSNPDAPTCSLPSLPTGRSGHTLDLLQNTPVVCGGYEETSCLQLTEGGKQWEEFSTLAHERVVHSSWVTGKGLLLLGGDYSPNTAELVPSSPGQTVTTYSLTRLVRGSCTVDVELDGDMVLVVTGGFFTMDQAYILDTELDITLDLPRLKVGRERHGCGYYETSGYKTFVVTGGLDSSNTALVSTEVLVKGGTWTLTENSLPSARWGMSTASLHHSVYGVGGVEGDYGQYTNEIVKYNKGTNKWEAAGTLPDTKYGVGLATSNSFKC